ncbi:hypothetical protein ACJD0Z_04170 [Flavobacteriaceae bacterium M23B6Z8]
MKTYLDTLNSNKAPAGDGIYFTNGDAFLYNFNIPWTTKCHHEAKYVKKTTLQEIDNSGMLDWVYCDENVHVLDVERNLKLTAGGGTYGGDGFVACWKLEISELLWLAFFEDSNPFEKLYLNREHVFAVSTHNCTWKFGIDNPLDLTIDCEGYWVNKKI